MNGEKADGNFLKLCTDIFFVAWISNYASLN